MDNELTTVAKRIGLARGPEDVFGALSGSSDEQLRAARFIFHSLSKIIHPDRYTLPADRQVAHGTMTRLNGLWGEARFLIKAGRYTDRTATSPTVRITTRKRPYEVGALLGTDEVCQHYVCQFEGKGAAQAATCKIARTPDDNDLLQAEAQALRHLRADMNFARLWPFVPECFDSLLYDDGHGAPRRVNIVDRSSNVYSLADIHAQYPHGIDPRDAAWIWRKLLIALGFAHARGVVHGAVLPPHILIESAQHGLILENWLYALHEPIESGAHLTAIVSAYEAWYPAEVFDRQPVGPGLDIFMGARGMVYLLGGDPITGQLPATVSQAIASFFRGCLLPAPQHRPQQAWDLLNEFTQLIERLWGPRTFRPFAMPLR
jgi:serine/threonine protein kinase